jgi:hypothetical protein
VATATGEAEEDEEEDWEAGTAKVAGTEMVAEKARETLLRVILCPKRRKWWSRQTNFEDFSKAAKRRFQKSCGKERDKKEDTKRHSTRRKEHTDTVYA